MSPVSLRSWRHRIVLGTAAVVVLVSASVGALWVHYSRIVDARLHGEKVRVVPRVFARPLTLRVGQTISVSDLVARLNDVGYVERSRVERPGDFAVAGTDVVVLPRAGPAAARAVTVSFAPRPARARGASAPKPTNRILRIEVDGHAAVPEVECDRPLLTALVSGAREKRRRVALDAIPARMREAVLAIEDRRFYLHPGFDPLGIARGIVTNALGNRRTPVGRSTLTQQLARMFFLRGEFNAELQAGQRSYRRKILEGFMAIILEAHATKDEILELYLNDVYLGHRGSFAIHGVAEASRMYFGKNVSNLTLSEAALIAGLIQSPGSYSPFANPERARERRNQVLRAMADAGFIAAEAAERAAKEPVRVVAHALDNEAPYFVDYLVDELDRRFPGLTAAAGPLDIYSTLDLNLQRAALDAVREGLARVDAILARRRVRRGETRPIAQTALVAVDPRTGEILALIGGRSYNTSQFNRADSARRQAGSTFKPFVYLAAFERAAEEGHGLTPASLVWDEPTTWTYDNQAWSPRNYDDEYDGEITLRRALAMSRNIATIKVAEQTGFDRVAALWTRTKIGSGEIRPYPSIALGTVELTPLQMAEAYTVFPNLGVTRKLRGISTVVSGDRELRVAAQPGARVARPDTTFLVTHMMRSVLNEGTGASARAAGFTADAAAKSGTTNDLKDAWFVGFTPDLLVVVWVGLDDSRPLGLSGAQAALPIWTAFMTRALAGRASPSFPVPEGVAFAEIDRDTGKRATPACPRVTTEAFLAGMEPQDLCELHRF